MNNDTLRKKLDAIIEKYTQQEQELVLRAYHIAEDALDGIKRGNDNPFLEHPIGVAAIVANEIGLMPEAIAAVFLQNKLPVSHRIPDVCKAF